MKQTSVHFRANAIRALSDPNLRKALDRTTDLLKSRRTRMLADYPAYDVLRDFGERIKDHTLRNLDYYLETFERSASASGAKVHWARTPAEATDLIVGICRSRNAKSATRVKSMLGEEIGIGEALKQAGIERVETDLAEHIIQLANDPPSHIVMPAMHKTREQVETLFCARHREAPDSGNVAALVESARRELRPKYMTADVAISGANFIIAETGSTVMVTNEGNAELTTTPPPVHIVNVGIEKLVPTMEHCVVFLRLLARAALGTEITQYTTFHNGPKRSGDRDGPAEMHIVLVDNGRTDMLGSNLRPMLRCIRCGACMNHCPVYGAVGGHAYGHVYPGPMGAILTPALTTLEATSDLPNACTLNGRCQEVCPVNIPLPNLLRQLRAEQWRKRVVAKPHRFALSVWAEIAKRPSIYRVASRAGVRILELLAGKSGRIRSLFGARAWTRYRDLTAPQAGTFLDQYKQGRRR